MTNTHSYAMARDIELKGCGTALLTPFRGESVDSGAFARTVDRQVEAGIDFLVPLGTTGETPCLSAEEKREVLRIAIDHSGGRPVVAGIGSNNIPGTVANMELLGEADAFLVVVPFYNKPTQEGMYLYFKEIASRTDKPVILYNVPGRTGSNLAASTAVSLAEAVPNIVAVKEASGNYAQIGEILRGRPEGFIVLSGNDGDTLDLMERGAEGVISVASNVAPAEMVAFTRALLEGRMTEAREMSRTLEPLFNGLFVESNPIPAKAAMARLGLMENILRLPLTAATDETENLIAQILDDLWKK